MLLYIPESRALGPVAFMHCPSTIINPDATLGHHRQDTTHITFGVATAGFGLPPTGIGVDVSANFSDDPMCELAVNDLYEAPDCGL